MNITWLLRMAKWARNPPGPARVRLMLIVFGLVILIAGIEYLFDWPDALSLEPRRGLSLP
jgi:predicted acyltransferase